MRKFLVSLLMICVLSMSIGITAFAAEFDPNFYATSNPDVVAALGNDAQVLFNHYQNSGKAEGRLAYAGAQPGEEVTFDPKAAAKAAAEQQQNFIAAIAASTSKSEVFFNSDGIPVNITYYETANKIQTEREQNSYQWIGTVAWGIGRANYTIDFASKNGYPYTTAMTEFRDPNTKKKVMTISNTGDVFDAKGKLIAHYDL